MEQLIKLITRLSTKSTTSSAHIVGWKRVLTLMSLATIFLMGCKTRNINYERPENQSKAILNQKLLDNDFQFNTLSFKVAVKSELVGDKKSFKASVRMRKDSVVWSTITFAGKPLITTIISRDTIKYLNKISKEYFIGDFDYLNRVMGTEFHYDMLEDLLIGDAIGYDSTSNYDTDIDSTFYLISSLSKRKIRKALTMGAESKEKYIYRHWLEPKTFQMNRQMVNNLSDSTSIDVGYSEYLEIEDQVFPGKEQIIIYSPADTGSLELKISRLKRNIPLTFPFRVTDKYTQIE